MCHAKMVGCLVISNRELIKLTSHNSKVQSEVRYGTIKVAIPDFPSLHWLHSWLVPLVVVTWLLQCSTLQQYHVERRKRELIPQKFQAEGSASKIFLGSQV